MRLPRWLIFAALAVFVAPYGSAVSVADAYLDMFLTRASLAGNHSYDRKLEDFSPEKLVRWVVVNEAERDRLTKY